MRTITKQLFSLGLPIVVAIMLVAVATLWVISYRSQRDAYYTDYIYRTLGTINEAMADRLHDSAGALENNLQEAEKSNDKEKATKRIFEKVTGLSPATLSTEEHPLYLYKHNTDPEDAAAYATFEFLARHPADGVLDDLIVSDMDGNVLYQQSYAGQRWDKVKFLLPKEQKSSDSPAAGLFSEEASSPLEKKFRVFKQELILTAGAFYLSDDKSGSKRAPKMDLMVFGLVKKDRLESDVLALPFTTYLLFFFVAVGVLFSIPMLRVCLLRPLHRLKRRDGIWITASTFMTASLVTFGLLHVAFFELELESRVHGTIETLGDKITSTVGDDFSTAKQILSDLTAEKCKDPASCDPGVAGNLAEEKWKEQKEKAGVWFRLGLDQFTWVDADGKQQAKLTLAPYTLPDKPPLVSVPDREFFQAIRENRGWQLASAEKPGTVFVESVHSRTTGENVAVLSMPLAGAFDGQSPEGTQPVGNPPAAKPVQKLKVASLSFRPSSLFRTFLPPSYGFAIISQEGRILFHSQDERNLRQWMLEDVLDPEPLRSAIFGRSYQDFATAYLGKDHHLHARPFVYFAGSPWTLVVFSDKEYFRSALADVMMFALLLYAAYAIVMFTMLAVLLGRAAGPREATMPYFNPLVWLWPNQEKYRGYYGLIAVFAVALALYGVFLFMLPPVWLVWATLGIPLVAFLAGYRLARGGPTAVTDRLAASPLRRLSGNVRYTIAATLFIQLVAVMPCTAFYRIAFDHEMRQLARHEDLRLMKYLKERNDKAKNTALTLFTEEKGNTQEAGKEAFVEAIAQDYRGVYKKDIPVPVQGRCSSASPGILDELQQMVPGRHDPFSVETKGTTEPTDPQFQWCGSADSKEKLRVAGLQGSGEIELTSERLSMSHLLGVWAILFSLVTPLLVWSWMYVMNRKLFSLDDVHALPPASDFKQHTLVLSNLRASKMPDLGAKVLDLASVEPDGWDSALGELPDGSRVVLERVVLEHLEQRIDDPVALQELVKLIEKWRDRACLIVCSSVDPLLHLELNSRASGDPTQAVQTPGTLSYSLRGFQWRSLPSQSAGRASAASAAAGSATNG